MKQIFRKKKRNTFSVILKWAMTKEETLVITYARLSWHDNVVYPFEELRASFFIKTLEYHTLVRFY